MLTPMEELRQTCQQKADALLAQIVASEDEPGVIGQIVCNALVETALEQIVRCRNIAHDVHTQRGLGGVSPDYLRAATIIREKITAVTTEATSAPPVTADEARVEVAR